MKKFGYYKLFSVCPTLHLGNPIKNVESHIEELEKIQKILKKNQESDAVVLFPELSITGYTCEDLFHSQTLINNTLKALGALVKKSAEFPTLLIVVGTPIEERGKLYNCAMTIKNGKIVSVHPKTYLPNYREFYENRFFTSGQGINESITLLGQSVTFSTQHLLKLDNLTIGIEICEDLWAPISPSAHLAIGGAKLILNLSASNELVGKAAFRKELVKTTSEKLNCGYLYASAGVMESTKDLVFGGHMMYAENGSIFKESEKLQFHSTIMECEIDTQKIDFERRKNKTFGASAASPNPLIEIDPYFEETNTITRRYSPTPFVPEDSGQLESRVAEILDIQASGLARRMLSIPNCNLVLGLSGGLDSTLALLVCIKACEKIKVDTMKIHAISMPGFGTSERTKGQSKDLAASFKINFKEIDITEACKIHLRDIDHEDKVDVVYENTQARERTQILFDYGNKVNGIVVGTGDLSEAFQGFMTYSADHLSSWNPNASIPKSLVKFLIKYYPCEDSVRQVLDRILETKISPELLPLDSAGNIQHSTEDLIGSYEVNDFYMFHYLRNGFGHDKICFLARTAFKGQYTLEELDTLYRRTYRKFRINQFKRTTTPPGLKVGSVSLSSRGDWRCPDEWDGEDN